MTANRVWTWNVAVLALALGLTACSDFSQHRFGGVRRSADDDESPPRPSPALAIRNAPSVLPRRPDEKVQQATFVPEKPPVAVPPQGAQNPLRLIYHRAAQTHAQLAGYTMLLTRREVAGGRKQPEEVLEVKLRQQPYSVHIKCVAGSEKGREVLFVSGKFDNKIQILLASGDLRGILGRRHSVRLDDPAVKAASRYPINETGLGSMIERFGRVVDSTEKTDGREGTAKYLGLLKRPEFEAKIETVYQELPAGAEPGLPKGGRRWWFFDPPTGLPVLRITHDATGEVEYYRHDQIRGPARLTDDDFNPARLWRK
ncbi:MAG: DUF1571 domain-containing protein [Planctomycetes bacterium]|nr:DUF1571 domain-containing protein [Planctomycetota bacterium]